MGHTNDMILHGLDYKTGNPIIVNIKDGYIQNVSLNTEIAPINNVWVGPGLVDIQVNGFKGFDFNTYPLTEEVVRNVTKFLWQEGVTSYMPTVITNSNERIEHALEVISNFIESDEMGENLLGIHLEGPFISPEDGPRGAHNPAYVKAPDWELFQSWQERAKGHIRIITLSPEWPNSPEFIKKCVKEGVKVAIGHTAANTEQIKMAVDAGASLSTHLGNGAHLFLPRHPNYIWDQLAMDELWAGVIGDGFHLPISVLKVIYRVKQSRTILVSDVVKLAGLEPGQYTTHVGGNVVLTPDGKLHLAKEPNLLAGSVKSLRQGIETFIKEKICDLDIAWEMASMNPIRMLDKKNANILCAGSPADLVLFQLGAMGEIKVMKTIKSGKLVYER
jgi:N-acetylglucosamine-6-phosphate deacetylase